MKFASVLFAFIVASFFSTSAIAQEVEDGLRYDAVRVAKHNQEKHWQAELLNYRGGQASLLLPFFDDFSRASLPTNDPTVPIGWQRWQDTSAYINTHFPINPPTIGVATLDGLKNDGYPYDFTDQYAWGPADTMTSLPINLGSYTSGDNVYLTFQYEPGGLGNYPDDSDSLILEFYSPFGAGQWAQVWTSDMTAPVDTFTQVFIQITDPAYFLDGFQFRFRNFATLSGSFDLWHIDYVLLDAGIDPNNFIFDEVSQQFPENTLLNNGYTAMPWTHFIPNASGYMKSSFNAKQRNLGNDENIVTGFSIKPSNASNQNFFSVDFNTTGNANSSFTRNLSLNNYVYPGTLEDTCLYFDIKTFINPTDAHLQNDTSYFRQYFYNYYAYDDGTAERSYGLAAAGGNLAMKFRSDAPDSLLGLFIYWLPSGNDYSAETFLLRAWGDGGTVPGSELGENFNYFSPHFYHHGRDYFSYYAYDNPILVEGNFYVGYVQSNANPMPVGNDKNTNNNPTKLYYNLGFGQSWQQSTVEGSLMIRPVFKSGKSSVWNGIAETTSPSFVAFPNPTSDKFYIQGLNNNEDYTMEIIDAIGNRISAERFNHTLSAELDFGNLSNGIYFVRVTSLQTGMTSVLKTVKQ